MNTKLLIIAMKSLNLKVKIVIVIQILKKNCNLIEKKCQNKESGSSMSSVFQLESNSSLNINSKVNSDKDKLGVELESDKKYTDDKLSKKQSNQNQQNIEVLSWKSSDIDCK